MKSESEECAKCGIKNVFTFTTSASCLYLTLPLGSVNKTQHNIQNVYYTGGVVLFPSSGKLYASFSDFATILHHYFATSAFFQKSKKHLPAALLLLKFNLPKI